MNKAILILFLLISNLFVGQNTSIPDPNFEQALINLGYDSGPINSIVPTANIDTITYLNITVAFVSDLTGIEDFTNLMILDCSNNQLTNLNVTLNTALTELYCANNQLTNLNLTQNVSLTELFCNNNQLTNLNVSQNTVLTDLDCSGNPLNILNVTQNTALTRLWCIGNQLSNLDVTQNSNLTNLNCGINQLDSLDVTQNTALTVLWFANNLLNNINLSQNSALTQLTCFNNQLTNLNVSQNTALTVIKCNSNQITTLDVTQNIALTGLICSNNQLSTLDLGQNSALILLRCDTNQLFCLNMNNGNNSNVAIFDAYSNPFTCIQVDSVIFSINNWTNIDNTGFYNIACSICGFTFIEELSSSSMNGYPNPTSSHFTIEGLNKLYNLTIYNTLGQLLYTENNILETSKRVDVSKYSKGLIFIRIESEGEVYHSKLLKQ